MFDKYRILLLFLFLFLYNMGAGGGDKPFFPHAGLLKTFSKTLNNCIVRTKYTDNSVEITFYLF